MVEAGLARLGARWDRTRVDYALRQHEQWYVGDGHYGDGPAFHWDYYNSYVIQPMLLDVLDAVGAEPAAWAAMRAPVLARARRLRRHPGAPDRARRHLPCHRPVDRVSGRRLPAAGAGRAPARAAGRRRARPGAGRAVGGAGAHPRRPGHLRRERLAAHRPGRASARRGRTLHLDRQPLPVRDGVPAARPAAGRPVLVAAGAAVDVPACVVRRRRFPSITRCRAAPDGLQGWRPAADGSLRRTASPRRPQ